jgi:hypothetical protein
VKRLYLDEKGNPTYNMDGTTGYQIDYDAQGNISKISYLGTNGKDLSNSNGNYAIVNYKYDSVGNNVEIVYLDENEKECMVDDDDNDGHQRDHKYYKKEMSYEPKTNFLKEVRYYNLYSLIHTDCYEYDSSGNLTKQYTKNANGTLLSNTVVENTEYDKNNRAVKIWYTDLFGRAAQLPGSQYTQVLFNYDRKGNVIETSYLDRNNVPSVNQDGAYKRICRYDGQNRLIYEKSLDKNGQPLTSLEFGSAETSISYDRFGNRSVYTCLDGSGHNFICRDGWHVYTAIYNERNNLASVEYKDENGQLVESKRNGYARCVMEYDEKANRTCEKYYNSKKELILEYVFTYNKKDQQTVARVLNGSGKEDDSKYFFSKYTIQYEDDDVTPKRRTFYNAQGVKLASQTYNKRKRDWNDFN